MGNQPLASKVIIQEESPKQVAVPNLPTAVVGFVGVTEKGVVGKAFLCTSEAEFAREFGGHVANSDMAAVVNAFFKNGGNTLYIVRTVHYTDVATPSSKTSVAATITLVDRAGSPVSTLKVDAISDGTWGNSLKVKIAAPTNGDTDKFDLFVLSSTNVVLEQFPNLSMLDSHERYVELIVNATPEKGGSTLIKVTDLDSASVAPADRPAIATTSLATGADGLGSLADTDFIGSSVGKTGIYALDLIDNLTLLAVPGRATSAVHNAMITYGDVERSQQVFCVLDPPASTSATGMVTYVKSTAALQGLTEMAAIYWPRVKILNPSKAVYGTADQVVVPPSGHICGVFSRVDNARVGGVYDPPAGPDKGVLLGVLGFETDETLDETKRDLVFPERINPLTTYTGGPRFIDGARTLKATGNFPTVAERRGVSNIERSIKLALQVYRHQNNTTVLRAGIYRTIFLYLLSQMSFGALASTNPDTAFFVDFGDALNPPSQKNMIVGRVGLATAQPAEYIVVKFSQDTRAAEALAAGK